MKKGLIALFSIILVFCIFLGGCSSSSSSEPVKTKDGKTHLELWTFNELHGKYYQSMVKTWNEKNSKDQIDLKVNVYPYEDLHNKLLVALQTGKGAPDISDIEISKFANFLKGKPQLVTLDDVVEPEKANIVPSRLDIYSKDGHVYGLPFHVGAAVIYYNKEILDKAGVNPDDIKTWDDFEKYGKIVKEKTGKPMTTLETADQWSVWPQLAQMPSKDDFLTQDKKPNLSDSNLVKVLQYQQKLIKEGIAVPAPGNIHHSEEYYGFMNKGGAASVWMPMWYMGRFTDYMPDLKGKIVIKPMPAWKAGEPRSAGMGGTGTVVTNQSKAQELAKKFIAYAKISKEGGIQIWKQLGFDPVRPDVWTAPELHEQNKFTDYFINGKDIFNVELEIKNEIEGVNIGEKTPDVSNAIKTTVMTQVLVDKKDPEKVLKEAASQIK